MSTFVPKALRRWNALIRFSLHHQAHRKDGSKICSSYVSTNPPEPDFAQQMSAGNIGANGRDQWGNHLCLRGFLNSSVCISVALSNSRTRVHFCVGTQTVQTIKLGHWATPAIGIQGSTHTTAADCPFLLRSQMHWDDWRVEHMQRKCLSRRLTPPWN